MATKETKTKTKTKEETRLAILAAAQALFSRFGPLKTSVADIARELGMSPANIYTGDWPKIERLFLASARHLRDDLRNEKNVLQLLAIQQSHQWKFVTDFHRQRSAHVVRAVALRAEDGHDAVAHEHVDHAAIPK